jgi:predicted NUDIX family phosphoesterase
MRGALGMAQQEQVLVVKREIFGQAELFRGLMFDMRPYLDKIFARGALRFMQRPLAEKDPTYKQIIPYVLISCNGKFLTYVRGKRAGETRLVGNRSIGIGGHINPIDDMPLLNDTFETYKTAVEREVAEEVNINSPHADKIVALLNDDSNEVGRVHLGIVHHWVLDEPNVERREQMITQLSFMSIGELRTVKDTMETWSQLCVDGLERIAPRGASN